MQTNGKASITRKCTFVNALKSCHSKYYSVSICNFAIIKSSTLFVDFYCRYGSAFGSSVAHVQGIGYVQKLITRLTHTPVATHNSSTNTTLNDNPITFSLGQSLYINATHQVVVLSSRLLPLASYLFITSCLFSSNHRAEFDDFAKSAPLPYTRPISCRSGHSELQNLRYLPPMSSSNVCIFFYSSLNIFPDRSPIII